MPAGTPPDQLAVLMEVVPQHSTHSAGGRTWPLRALSPGAAVTAVLAREAERGSGRGAVPEETPVVLAAEHHSRQSRDWYAITAAIDFVAFIYVALFYNKVVASARSLSGMGWGEGRPGPTWKCTCKNIAVCRVPSFLCGSA